MTRPHNDLLDRSRVGLLALFGCVFLAQAPGAMAEDSAQFDAGSLEFFEKDVRPLLIKRCQSCHGPEKTKGGLRLDSRAAVLKGGDSGPAAIAGKPEESLLIEAIEYADALQMPPRSRLASGEVATLRKWVEAGLPWTPVKSTATPTATPAEGIDLATRKAAHWSWTPVRDASPPAVSRSDWALDAIDRFILARLEAARLTPAPDTDRRAWIRRVSFDLTGLPPSPDEVVAFQQDGRPDAHERVVDRLLASPHFGERWARHWMDLVRYAETRGHEFDPLIPNAWRYRDYLIRAFNADVPYDRFLTEQLAGDLIPDPRTDPTSGANESILGTGFWFLGEEVHSPVDIRQDETDRMDNRLDVMTKTFLGLTVACARCHDHKFDPIRQRDYYALSGFLISSTYRQVRYATATQERDLASRLQDLRDRESVKLVRLASTALRPGIEGLLKLPDRGELPPWLASARENRLDPFHPLTMMKGVPKGRFRETLAALLTEPAPAKTPVDPVVDYGTVGDLASWQNGYAFGLQPVTPGDVSFVEDRGKLRIGINDRPAAVREAGAPWLKPLKGDERDHGRLGDWDRPGQTLRSPEFTLKSGRLWYLARGGGRAYANVNAHLVVAGPLHGAVLTEWTDGGKGWRWVRHDLPAYKGHRLHVEFTPTVNGALGIAQVVDAEEPPSVVERIDPTLTRHLQEANPGDFPSLCRAYADFFGNVLDVMAAGRLAESSEYAPAADALMARFDHLAETDAEETRQYRAASAAMIESWANLAKQVPTEAPTAPAILDGNGVNEFLLIRGSSRTPGPEVPRRFLEVLDGETSSADYEPGTSGRLILARRLLDPTNPFTSRVAVNRVWHHLFGRGIVASVDNLGVLGEPPTHPELLDHLATRFMRDGWSLKRLIRAIVLSRTYRMSSRPDPVADAADPLNKLWHRRELRRIEAEAIRDAILSVSGRLNPRFGGPSVPVHLTEFMQGRGRPKESGPIDGDGRRSVYQAVRRNFLSPWMLAFDTPIPFTTMGRRNVSNVPAQALILLNDPFVIDQARRWADQVTRAESTCGGRIRSLYLQAFGRVPTSPELEAARDFVGGDAPTAWSDLAHVLLNSKEFVYVE